MTEKQAIIAGLICLDVTPDLSAVPDGQFQQLFQPGRLIRTGGVNCTPGGAVANTGLALHRLGVPARLIGKIGSDLFGQVLQDRLREASPHLADDLVIDLTLPTSFAIVINPPGSDRSFLYHPGANDTFYASDLPRGILENADLFHFGYPPLMRSIYRGDGAELVSILQRARRAGLSTSLDFALPDLTSPAGQLDWPSILENALPLVDLFFPSAEELVFLLNRDAYDRMSAKPNQPMIDAIEPEFLETLAETVLSYGVKALLVKLGKRGIYLHTAPAESWQKCGRGLEGLDDSWHSRQIWAPAFSAKVKRCTGAGDAAIAGFLASILRGTNPETALQMANAAGALSVENSDAIGALPGWDDIAAHIQRGWDTLPLAMDAQGWALDQAQGLWIK
jgi:sugar/nucleoside kinase (ribokinase family)